MTVPEENRPKTTSTDEVIATGADREDAGKDNGATSRTLREAMEEAGIEPEDVRDDT
ncbi:hypothetical protein [Streptomyces aureocirculatus]|uniref:hypothetical protein n=1 Tax=Streptomyces aureocirculatus TaxID=67275 RepID=UPI00146FD94C|nr:hypothetical protein [Streptomyces aureocirculatus]